MAYGERTMQKGDRGDDVRELQMRLAGFRGTVPDGVFGSGTELQVTVFQRDFMGERRPTGAADPPTLQAIVEFAQRFPLDFESMKCPCGVCDGFGRGLFKGRYRPGQPHIEAYYRYEYPGMHRMLLWSVRAAFFYMPEYSFLINSGYRCSERNKQRGRTSTNHHGKAIDLDVPPQLGEDKRDDMRRCDLIRGKLVELANAQIGWAATNRKALEPSDIAPTWVHYDVRTYERKYLKDTDFVKTPEELDRAPEQPAEVGTV